MYEIGILEHLVFMAGRCRKISVGRKTCFASLRNFSTSAPTSAHSVQLSVAEQGVLAAAKVCIEASAERGRRLVYRGAATRRRGDLLFHEEPLIAVSDPTAERACQACFLSLPPNNTSVLCQCGSRYCSVACQEQAWHRGHDALCGGSKLIDAWCVQQRVNFPRTAAAMLGRSLAADMDFVHYWERVNRLAHASTGLSAHATDDEYPVGWRDGYEHVVSAISPRMGGDKGLFFKTVFNLRFYARLMGTLRLNTFSFRCPLDVVPEETQLPVVPLSDDCCGGSTTKPGCDSEPSACGGLARAGEAPGGTVLFALASMANHDCSPNMDVELGPHARLSLRARTDIHEGEELTVTYLDSALPVELRQAKLGLYGFTCCCTLCTEQLRANRLRT